MKVFVAGASGAIGMPLVRQLLAAGHDVMGITRREDGAARIREAGAGAVIGDAFEAEALGDAVAAASPDVVINEMTSFPPQYDPRKASFFEATNRVRGEGGHNLIEAARKAGVKRFVSQSIAFLYAPEGGWVKDEGARPFTAAPGHFGPAVATLLGHEREVIESRDFVGLVLRYGQFYGRGTYYDRDGHFGGEVSRRRVPIVGAGTGTFSFIHVDDAAAATVAAVEHGAAGVYNVVDDEPATMRVWLPAYCEALGAKAPRHVPLWLARLIAGRATADQAVELRGASNEKAKRELSWAPAHPSWRQGFPVSLGG